MTHGMSTPSAPFVQMHASGEELTPACERFDGMFAMKKKGKEAALYKLSWDFEGLYVELLQGRGEYGDSKIIQLDD